MKIASTQRKGYILMEVMLASGIFAMAGVSLAVALNDISKTYLYARHLAVIRTELATQLAEAQLQPVVPGREKKETTIPGTSFTKEIAPLDINRTSHSKGQKSFQPMQGYYRLTIIAEWIEGNKRQNENAEIYLYRP